MVWKKIVQSISKPLKPFIRLETKAACILRITRCKFYLKRFNNGSQKSTCNYKNILLLLFDDWYNNLFTLSLSVLYDFTSLRI